VIVNSQLPSSSIKKKHNSVTFHKAREAVAAGYVRTGHIDGAENPSDVLTKAVSPTEFYRLTGPIYTTTQHKGSYRIVYCVCVCMCKIVCVQYRDRPTPIAEIF